MPDRQLKAAQIEQTEAERILWAFVALGLIVPLVLVLMAYGKFKSVVKCLA